MAELKTKKTEASVDKFIAGVADAGRREDCKRVIEIMKKATKSVPKMWGSSIVGFGSCLYKYPNGREMDWFPIGFSPRKQNLTFYIVGGINQFPELMKKLGRYKTGKGCLYINTLAEIDLSVLTELFKKSVAATKGK